MSCNFFVFALCTFYEQWTKYIRVPLVEQEMLTLPEHLSSPMVLSEVRIAQFSVLCFVRSFASFSFDHCINYRSFFDLRLLILL